MATGSSKGSDTLRLAGRRGIRDIARSVIARYVKRRPPLFAKIKLVDTFAQGADIDNMQI